MKKKFYKSGNPSALRRNRLINRMIAQIFAQATSFICLEALEKGKGFCGFPYYMDYNYNDEDGNVKDVLRGYMVYNPKSNQINDVVNVDGNNKNRSKDSTPIYQGRFVRTDDDRVDSMRLYDHIECLKEAFTVCEEKVSEALNLYEDGIIAISFVQNFEYVWVYAWIRRDAESAKKIREGFHESDLPF